LAKAAASLGVKGANEFAAQLVSGSFGQREIEALARHLTVPETHFFRSPETFDVLHSQLLPELIAAQKDSGRRLRIWSAGCATGPEPFSLAILVTRLIPHLKDWDISILATDINPAGFAAARAAEYTQWAFRGTPDWVVKGYFTKTREGRFRLSPAIREMVSFRYLNLVEDGYPTDCDLILCRNVIMYFARDTAVRVAERLHGSLKENGYLLVTASETSREVQGSLTSLTIEGEIVYKKTPAEELTAARATAETPGAKASPAKKWGRPSRSSRQRAARRTSANTGERTKGERGSERRKSIRGRNDQKRGRQGAGPPAEWSRDTRSTARPQRGGLRLERRAYSREEKPGSQAQPVNAREAAMEARLLADRGELDQALARCEAALACEKLNPSLYYLKASILQELGEAEEAEQALQSTLFLDDGFALARVMLGAIARSQSRPSEAAKHFREALALLEQMPSESVLAETNGLTAGEMVETVASLMESERVS
jgi:chemotaxis protein methyltransferase CheR